LHLIFIGSDTREAGFFPQLLDRGQNCKLGVKPSLEE
jgi:hypothetical protein